MNEAAFARLFDHSMVRPDATCEEVARVAETAVTLGTATLTVQPHYIRFATPLLEGSDVLLGTVVGFPHGNETPSMKAYQARAVLDLGAEEIDMVMNIPALKNEEKDVFMQDIEGVVRAAEGLVVKVITENGVLTDEEKRRACNWIAQTGARFVQDGHGLHCRRGYARRRAPDARGRAGAVPGQSRRRDSDHRRDSGLFAGRRPPLRLDADGPVRGRLPRVAPGLERGVRALSDGIKRLAKDSLSSPNRG